MSKLTPEQAQSTLETKLVKPLDELSALSIAAVAEAAATIAKAKAEAAAKAAEAAKAALARVEALKHAGMVPLSSEEAPPVPLEAAMVNTIAGPSGTNATPAPQETAPERPFEEKRGASYTPVENVENRRTGKLGKAEGDLAKPTVTVRRAADYANMPSGAVRMADSLRAASSARTAGRRKVKHTTAAKLPGFPLEPVAHQAGLRAPVGPALKRPLLTPRLILLFVLMIFFGLYATGNLPQFDQWTDSVVNSAHAHNDQVVRGILRSWHAIAYGVASLLLAAVIFLLVQNTRFRKK